MFTASPVPAEPDPAKALDARLWDLIDCHLRNHDGLRHLASRLDPATALIMCMVCGKLIKTAITLPH